MCSAVLCSAILRSDFKNIRPYSKYNIYCTVQCHLSGYLAQRFLPRFQWKAMIVDEAHRLKNSKSALYQELSQVCIKLMKFQSYFLLCCNHVHEYIKD